MKIELNDVNLSYAWFDLTPYISNTGLKQEEEDIDAAGSGRTQDGLMQRSRVAAKEKWSIVTIPIDSATKRTIKEKIKPQFFKARITESGKDPYIITGYAGNRATDFIIHKRHGGNTGADGMDLWKLTFSIIER